MRRLLYLCGPPGAGKTALLRTAIDQPGAECEAPLLHVRYAGGVQLGGGERCGLPGTDALPRTAAAAVLAWLASDAAPAAVVAEGIKFANAGFFAAVESAGYALTVAYLDTPLRFALERHRQRQGSAEPGIRTLCRREALRARVLALAWSEPDWWLDGTLPLPALAARLRRHPAVSGLHGGVQ